MQISILGAAQVLKTNLADLGWIRTAPYLIMFATSNLGAWAGDYFISTRRMTTAGGRKAVNTLGAICLPLCPCCCTGATSLTGNIVPVASYRSDARASVAEVSGLSWHLQDLAALLADFCEFDVPLLRNGGMPSWCCQIVYYHYGNSSHDH